MIIEHFFDVERALEGGWNTNIREQVQRGVLLSCYLGEGMMSEEELINLGYTREEINCATPRTPGWLEDARAYDALAGKFL
jgi:hypothetical protein